MGAFNPLAMDGRAVLVTGASSGIGRETAIYLSRLGARLVLVARDRGRLDETLAALEGSGHAAEVIDLAETEAIPDRVKELARRVGKLDGLVHAAGLHLFRPVAVTEPRDFLATMTVNVIAAQLVKGFRRKDVSARPAGVVLLSSVAGLVGQPGVAAYSASKGAVAALTRSLAMELAREGIRVNCLAPSVVRTPMAEGILDALGEGQAAALEAMHPLGLGTPRDVAGAAAFLLAETGRWVTGTVLVVDGGYTAH